MELKNIIQILFKNKRSWVDVTDEDKRMLFFKVNQWAARKHVDNANFFNKKGMDKAVAMDLWFEYFRDTLYIPEWFYPRAVVKKNESLIEGLDEKDMQILRLAYPNELNEYLEKQAKLKSPIEVHKIKKKRG